jgi:hypothetical protein
MVAAAVVLTVSAAMACSGGGSPDRPAAGSPSDTTASGTQAVPALPNGGGCGDVFFYGVSADDTVGLTVSSTAPLIATGVRSHHFDLPSADLTVRVEIGTAISQPYCNDVISLDHQVLVSRNAASGTVDIEIEASAGPCGSSGTATLHDVTVRADGDDLPVPDIVLSTDGLGCFAG